MFEKKKLLSALKEIALSIVVGFVFYLFIGFYVGNFMSAVAYEIRFAVMDILMLLLFTFSYGFIYMRSRKKEYELNMSDSPFDFKGEYIGFIKTEGRYILAILTTLAVIYELALFVWPLVSSEPGNPISTAILPVFIIGDLIGIPILRSLVAIVLDTALMTFFVVRKKKKIYKELRKS